MADHALLVADAGDELAGLASLVVRERLGWVRPEAWLADLVVRGDARRRGVGTLLLDSCVEIARARGCHLLRLECGSGRGAARAFYERHGFREAGADLRLTLR